MIRRARTSQTENTVDMLEELQASHVRQPETAQIETRPVRFAEGDVVALKHNWKRYLELFFLAILRISWLEPSEEDPLVYTVASEDNNNQAQCI